MTFALVLAALLAVVLLGLWLSARHIAAEELDRLTILRRLSQVRATWQPHNHGDHETLMRGDE